MMSGLGTGGYVAMGWNMGGGMANADMVVGKSWMSITSVNNNFGYLLLIRLVGFEQQCSCF
jgi:hypothetical protein